MPIGVKGQVARVYSSNKFLRNNVSRVICCFICVLLIWLCTFNLAHAATKIPSATEDFLLNDFAEVFTEDEKVKLLETSKKLTEYNDIKFVISTVNSLEGESIEKYAETMFNQYLGEDGFGALILLATEEKNVHIEVGSLMETHVDKAEIEQIIEKYAKEGLEKGEFGTAMIDLQKWFISYIMNEAFFPTLDDMNVEFTNNNDHWKTMNVLIAIGYVMCALLVACTVVLIVVVKGRKK